MKSTRLIISSFLTAVMLSAAASAQSKTEKVIAEARKPSPLEHNLQVLTDEIGGRVPGSPAMDKAVNWAVAAFKVAGADSVHTEAFTMPSSWKEGDTRVRIVSPVAFQLRAISLPWAPAFTPATPVRIVDLGNGSAEDFGRAGDVSGAVLLLHSKLLQTLDDLFAEYMEAPPVIERAQKHKAAAIAFISSREHDLMYRHINTVPGQPATIPMMLVAREDGERVARLLDGHKKVLGTFSLPNRIGPAFQSKNVVAEIKGSDRPDEFVILGAHLDAWDLGTGALDNGCNAALVIDALRAIKASGVRPRRSIRFILYSGEEQGMIGSREYVKQHRKELDNAVADIVFDEGTGAVTGYSLGGRKDIVSAITELTAPVKSMGVKEFTTDAFVGTDNLHLLLEGVPTLVANQEGANYLINYHASSDTLDKVDMPQLRKHVAIAAATAFAIADAPQRLGPRQSVKEVDSLLKETKLDEQLKVLGYWPEWEKIASTTRK